MNVYSLGKKIIVLNFKKNKNEQIRFQPKNHAKESKIV